MKIETFEMDGSQLLRERIAQFYPDCQPENVTVTNGGSEANYVAPWTLLESARRLACMIIEETSTLPTPSNHFGLDSGIRVGSGYDVTKSLDGLARAEALMRTVV